MIKCSCRKILWITIECQYCQTKRIKSNIKWERNHTFIYGEKVLVNDDFVGQNIKGIVINEQVIYHRCEVGAGYTEINYFVKLPDGYIKKFNRYNIKKYKENK